MSKPETMPTEFSQEAEMELVRNEIATTMTSVYRLRLKEKFLQRKLTVKEPQNKRFYETQLLQTQAQIKSEVEFIEMLRESENELLQKIKPNKEFTGDRNPEHNGPGHGVYPDPDWQEEKQA